MKPAASRGRAGSALLPTTPGARWAALAPLSPRARLPRLVATKRGTKGCKHAERRPRGGPPPRLAALEVLRFKMGSVQGSVDEPPAPTKPRNKRGEGRAPRPIRKRTSKKKASALAAARAQQRQDQQSRPAC